MKRGLVEWDEQEVPRATLDARVARVRAWGREHGFDALLFHTSDSHAQPVRYLTHFLLYWNEGVLVLPCGEDAEAVVVYGLSGRVLDWVRRTSTLTQAVTARDVGGAVALLLGDRAYQRVGIVEPDIFPAPTLARIAPSGPIDASDVLSVLGLDEAERVLRRTAERLTRQAFASVSPDLSQWQAAAAFHGSARLAGAEDVSLLVGEPPAWPGLPGAGRLPHGAYLLGRVEYKGAWHQAARTLGLPTPPGWFAELAASVRPGIRVGDLPVLRVEELSGPAPFRQLAAEATLRPGAVLAVTAVRDSVLWGETLSLPGSG